MKEIQGFYDEIGRPPTDVELETLAQTWSEHCVHKTFKSWINFTWRAPDGRVQSVQEIRELLRTYIQAATETVNRPWVRSAFVDDAGIIEFDDDFDLAFKVETHNHPSALEPFGGANTGIGGVVRDIIAVSARPIACTDVLCFGPQDFPQDQLPPGVLHPARVQEGVVAGIGDYGNKLGLPTVNGAVVYDGRLPWQSSGLLRRGGAAAQRRASDPATSGRSRGGPGRTHRPRRHPRRNLFFGRVDPFHAYGIRSGRADRRSHHRKGADRTGGGGQRR